MRLKSVGFGVLLGAIAGCLSQRPPNVGAKPSPPADSPLTAPERRIERVFSFGEKLGGNRAEVSKQIGVPLAVRVVMAPNRFNSDIDSGFVAVFRDWTVAYLRLRATGREFVMDIRLIGGAVLPDRLQCGRTR